MTKKLIIIIALFLSITSFANNLPILVTETTIVLDMEQTKELYFSFAKGDIVQFDLKMIRGKHIKTVELIELSGSEMITEFKTNGFSKKINIKNKGVYRFRFYSSSLTRRVCKIKIQRTPINASTQHFNTNWKWKTLRDTTYVPYTVDSITGYNTIHYKEKIRELLETKHIEDVLMNKNQRVHSYYNQNRSKTYLRVDLPNPMNTDLKEEKVIAWAYWIGVGQESQKAFQENVASVESLADGINTVFGDPITGLAIGTVSELILPKIGEDVYYAFIPDYENAENFVYSNAYTYFDKGKGIAAYGKNTRLKTGTFYIGLHNDNQLQGIDVTIKVVAVKEIKRYEYKVYDRQRKEPIIVSLDKSRMEVTEREIRIPVE